MSATRKFSAVMHPTVCSSSSTTGRQLSRVYRTSVHATARWVNRCAGDCCQLEIFVGGFYRRAAMRLDCFAKSPRNFDRDLSTDGNVEARDEPRFSGCAGSFNSISSNERLATGKRNGSLIEIVLLRSFSTKNIRISVSTAKYNSVREHQDTYRGRTKRDDRS